MIKKGLSLLGLAAISSLLWYAYFPASPDNSASPSTAQQLGLVAQPCWFTSADDWPAVNCYRMFVPENHQQGTKMISFPVIHFQRFSDNAKQPPVLHLGAGGPGAAMWLHNKYVVEYIWRDFEHSVLRQDRDLYLIDPRGTGMANPRFNCPAVTRHALAQLKNPQVMAEYVAQESELYLTCIQELQQHGVDIAAYHSLSVIQDLNLLQQALGLNEWSLFGVSYGAVYALLYADEYADNVDTLILDSPAFPALKSMKDPVARFLRPLQQLVNYCEFDPSCVEPIDAVSTRLQQLVTQLNADPIHLSLPSGFLGSPLPVKLTGDTFMSILYFAIYGHDIYSDIAKVITELEQRDISTFYRYIDNYVELIKDQNYSGISMISHLCYDEVPFVDHARLTAALQQGLTGHMRDGALYTYTWPADICPVFGETLPNKRMVQQIRTAIPTLFLQGSLDSVTPLEDVQQQLEYFSQRQLRVYPLAHGVHGSLDCVDEDLQAFLAAPLQDSEPAMCSFSDEDL